MSLDPSVIKTNRVCVGTNASNEPVYVNLRGLNASDISILFQEHEAIMSMLFGEKIDFTNESAVARELTLRFPLFAYLVIALSINEPEKAELIAKLPLPIQIELFMNVFRLTMPLGVKETVKKLKEELKPLLKSTLG